MPPNSNNIISDDASSQLIVQLQIAPDVICINEDKAKLIYSKYYKILKKPTEYISSIGLMVSLLITTFTTSTNVFGLNPDIWKGIFMVLLIFSFGWVIYVIRNIIKYGKEVTDEQFVEELKNNKQTITGQVQGTPFRTAAGRPKNTSSKKTKNKRNKQ
jgi:hypothetical protein